MKRFLVMMAVLLFASRGMADEFFKWMDERGTVHFTDTEASVPQKYKDDVERRRMPEQRETSPASTLEPTQVTKEPRDRFGRGRDFWVTWANEAKNRLTRAEDAYNRLLIEYKETQEAWGNAISTAQRIEYRNKMESLKVDMERRRGDIRKAKKESEIKIPEAAERAGAPAEWVK